MARKVGQIVRRGARTWLVRVYNGRDHRNQEAEIFESDRLRRFAGRSDSSEQDAGRARPGPQSGLVEADPERVPGSMAGALRQTVAAREELSRLGRPAAPIREAGTWRERPRHGICTGYPGALPRIAGPTPVGSFDSIHARCPPVGSQAAGPLESPLGNPADSVNLPRRHRSAVAVLSLQQTRTFVKAIAGHAYEGLLALAMTTGMRPSEYLALTWNDIDLGTVSVSRSLKWRQGGWQFADTKRPRSRRVVKLQAWVISVLREQRAKGQERNGDDLVFRAKRGGPIRESHFVQRYFKPLLRRLGCPTSGSMTCATRPQPFH